MKNPLQMERVFLCTSVSIDLFQIIKNFFSDKARRRANRLFDSQQLIVLADSVGAAHRTGLDLTGPGGDDRICRTQAGPGKRQLAQSASLIMIIYLSTPPIVA